MSTASDPGRTYITVTINNKAIAEKLERVVLKTSSSKNAILVGLLAVMSEDELEQKFQLAEELGMVQSRYRPSAEHKELLAHLNKLSMTEVQALLAQIKSV
jgi:hypothetical protein